MDGDDEKGGCDEIGGKKFPSLPPPELRYLLYFTLLYFTYSLPTRSKEKERNKLNQEI